MYTYEAEKQKTLSGLYVFNPKTKAEKCGLQLKNRYIQKGELLTIVHSFYLLKNINALMSQSITLMNSADPTISRAVRMTTKISNTDYYEFTMRTDLSQNFSDSQTEIFTDNSVSSQKRKFYDFEEAVDLKLTEIHEFTYIGLNGYASIDGSAFRNEDDKYFAFSNSNSLLLNAVSRNIFEVMLMRNTNHYDDKGITETLFDKNVETFDQMLYFAQSTNDYYTMRKKISPILNDKLRVSKTKHVYRRNIDTSTHSLINKDLSADFAGIDLVDLQITGKKEDVKVNMKLRNTNPYDINLTSFLPQDVELPTGTALNPTNDYVIDQDEDIILNKYKDDYEDIRDLLADGYQYNGIVILKLIFRLPSRFKQYIS